MIPLPEALFWLLLVALPYVVLRVRRAWVLWKQDQRVYEAQREMMRCSILELRAAGRAHDAQCETYKAMAAQPLWRWTP